jgi:hypothetical protein
MPVSCAPKSAENQFLQQLRQKNLLFLRCQNAPIFFGSSVQHVVKARINDLGVILHPE